MSSSFVCLYVFVFFLNWKQPKKTKPWTLYFQRTNMKTHNFVSNPIWKWRWTHLCQPFGLQTCLWKNCWWEVIYVSHLAFKHAFDKIVDGRSVEDLNWPPIIGSPMANVCTSVWRWCWHVWRILAGSESDTFDFWVRVFHFMSGFFAQRNWVFPPFAADILSWRATGPWHKEVPLISLSERTSKSVSCKKGKELRGHSIQGGLSKNLQGGSLTNLQGRSWRKLPLWAFSSSH